MSTAEKFKALGAGNGLTFPKAKKPTEVRNRPTTVLTLKECMAWYWLLEDIDLTLTLRNTHGGEEFISEIHLQFDIISGHDEPIQDGGAGAMRFYDGAPKDRASLHPTERTEMADGQFLHHNHQAEIPTPQTGGVGPVNNNGLFFFELYMAVEWFDDDTASVTVLVDDGYHRFVLTNLPTTSDLFTTNDPFDGDAGSFLFNSARLNYNHHKEEALTPTSLGTISTPYGDLTAYDVSMDTNSSTNEVTAINGTVQFYDFGS